jgi:hypothetical protein
MVSYQRSIEEEEDMEDDTNGYYSSKSRSMNLTLKKIKARQVRRRRKNKTKRMS